MNEFMEVLKENEGIVVRGGQRPADWDTRLKETIDLLTNAKGIASHRRTFLIREAMTTADFPLLFADAIDRQVLAMYKATVPVWQQYVRTGTVSRIFPQIGAKRFSISGGDQVLEYIPQKGEYKPSKLTEGEYDLYVWKYGRQFDISWEAIINDDLGAIRDIATRFYSAAKRTESRLVAASYANDVGAHTAGHLFENGVNEDVLALTIANLETVLARVAAFTDVNGEPILVTSRKLVVGPALELTARAILTSALKQWTEVGGGAGIPVPTANVLPQMGIQLVVDPYLPIVDSTHPGSWYVFADPNDIACVEADHLVGHETPEVCMKASNKVSMTGAPVSPMDGDFETDNVLYRVRDVFGANKMDWRGGYANIHA